MSEKQSLLDVEWQSYTNLCNVANCKGDFDLALQYAEKASFVKPNAESLCNIGITLSNMRRFRDAIEIYRQAIRLDQSNNILRYNLAFALLSDKQLKEGYDLYGMRLVVDTTDIFKGEDYKLIKAFISRFPQLWDGKAFFKHLYVFVEQGMGDTIQFIRYLPFLIEDAKKMGGKITIEVQRNLLHVVREKYPEINVTARDGDTWPLFRADIYDTAFSICSLGRLYWDRAAEVPYLPSKPTHNKKMKVGLCWAGAIAFPNDYVRSIKLSEFKRLPSDGIDYYSFQMGQMHRKWPQDEKVNLFDYAFPFAADYNNEIVDFRDTMRLINEMDLIISVDTSLVHLAGAMGKDVWLINKSLSDWRWCPDITEDNSGYSYLYPSVRIFTQKKYREWDELMEQIAAELEQRKKNFV